MAGETLSGRCLCGAVTFSARIREPLPGASHRSMGRHWESGIPVSVMVHGPSFAGGAFGADRALDPGERASSKACGSSLARRMEDGACAPVARTPVDPAPDRPLAKEILTEDEPTGGAFACGHRRLTGEDVIALFTGDQQTEPRAE